MSLRAPQRRTPKRQRRGRSATRAAPRASRPLQPAAPEVWQMVQERQRALLRGFASRADRPGALRWPRWAAAAAATCWNCCAWALRRAPARAGTAARAPRRRRGTCCRAPRAVAGRRLQAAPVPAGSQDLVLQSTVFSSLLDDAFQQRLAEAMWRWLKPGGAVLWYDFTVDNPRNPDVRGVPLARVRALFPQALWCSPPRDAGAAAGARRVRAAPGAVPGVQRAAAAAHPRAGLARTSRLRDAPAPMGAAPDATPPTGRR
jgi:hypothetical protein